MVPCGSRERIVRMPSVLHLTAGFGPAWYGPGVSLDDLCRALAARDWRVVLAGAYRSALDHPECALAPVEDRERNYRRAGFPAVASRRLQFSPALLRWLLANAEGFDLVHVHSLYCFPGIAGLLVARARKLPYVISLHDALAPVQRRKSRRKKALANWVFLRRALDEAAAIVYTTAGEREAAAPMRIRARTAVLSWGFSCAPFAALPERGSFRARFLNGSNSPLVLFLGRLTEKKGLDRLMAAFKQVLRCEPEAILVIAGDGDPPRYRRVVDRWVAEQGLGAHTVFTGLLRGTSKLAALTDADLFVLPSSSENFGIAMFEAMACRVPVIISSGVQLSSDVCAHRAGLVADRPCDLAAAICRLLCDRELRRELGDRGYAYARQFGWDKTAARLIDLYREILSERTLGGGISEAPSGPFRPQASARLIAR